MMKRQVVKIRLMRNHNMKRQVMKSQEMKKQVVKSHEMKSGVMKSQVMKSREMKSGVMKSQWSKREEESSTENTSFCIFTETLMLQRGHSFCKDFLEKCWRWKEIEEMSSHQQVTYNPEPPIIFETVFSSGPTDHLEKTVFLFLSVCNFL